MSGYLSEYKTKERIRTRLARRNAGNRFIEAESGKVIIVIDGEFEGMIAKMTSFERGRSSPRGVQFQCEVLNDDYCVSNTGQLGQLVWLERDVIDLYADVIQEETLFHMDRNRQDNPNNTHPDSDRQTLHRRLLQLFDLNKLLELKEQFLRDAAVGKHGEIIDVDNYLVEQFGDVLAEYHRKEGIWGEDEWFWKTANELLAWKPDCLEPYELESQTVGNMTGGFMDTVYEARQAKQLYEEDASKARLYHEMRRTAIEASSMLKAGLDSIKKFESITTTHLMILPPKSSESNWATGEYALPDSTRETLENLIGGLQEVSEASTFILASLASSGKGPKLDFSSKKVEGDGDCELRRPETEDETAARFKKPRYD